MRIAKANVVALLEVLNHGVAAALAITELGHVSATRGKTRESIQLGVGAMRVADLDVPETQAKLLLVLRRELRDRRTATATSTKVNATVATASATSTSASSTATSTTSTKVATTTTTDSENVGSNLDEWTVSDERRE